MRREAGQDLPEERFAPGVQPGKVFAADAVQGRGAESLGCGGAR